MSRLYKTVKRYYDAGIYDKSDVGKFVEAGKLLPSEYEMITGELYPQLEEAKLG